MLEVLVAMYGIQYPGSKDGKALAVAVRAR